MAALQDGEGEYEPQERGLTRRRAILFGLGAGVVGASGAYFAMLGLGIGDPAGARTKQPPVTDEDAEEVQSLLALARRMAAGPFDKLVDRHATYIWIVEMYVDNDPQLMEGLSRLARFALLDRGERSASIAKRLVLAYGQRVPPPELRDSLPDLETLLLEWRTKKR